MSAPAWSQSGPPSSAAPGQCLRQNMVDGWKVLDDRTMIVTDRVGKRFRVSLAPGCRDLKWPMRLGFQGGSGFGLSCVGRHDFLYVPANGGSVSQRCVIDAVTPYTAEMAHADAAAKAMDKAR